MIMKKLGKLSINAEKVIKNEDLVNLKGGYGPAGWCCRTSGRPSGEVQQCSDNAALLNAFCYVWEGFGYECNCTDMYYA